MERRVKKERREKKERRRTSTLSRPGLSTGGREVMDVALHAQPACPVLETESALLPSLTRTLTTHNTEIHTTDRNLATDVGTLVLKRVFHLCLLADNLT